MIKKKVVRRYKRKVIVPMKKAYKGNKFNPTSPHCFLRFSEDYLDKRIIKAISFTKFSLLNYRRKNSSGKVFKC